MNKSNQHEIAESRGESGFRISNEELRAVLEDEGSLTKGLRLVFELGAVWGRGRALEAHRTHCQQGRDLARLAGKEDRRAADVRRIAELEGDLKSAYRQNKTLQEALDEVGDRNEELEDEITEWRNRA